MSAWKTRSKLNDFQIVLVVSRDSKMVAAWDILFKQRNCYVIHETTPRHALQAARLLAPALVILDLDLSRAERSSLCEELRAATIGAIFLLAPKFDTGDDWADADECLSATISPAALLTESMTWLARQKRRAPRELSAQI